MSGEIPRNPMKKNTETSPGPLAFISAAIVVAVLGTLAVQFAWNIGIVAVAAVPTVSFLEAGALLVGLVLLRVVAAGANPGT